MLSRKLRCPTRHVNTGRDRHVRRPTLASSLAQPSATTVPRPPESKAPATRRTVSIRDRSSPGPFNRNRLPVRRRLPAMGVPMMQVGIMGVRVFHGSVLMDVGMGLGAIPGFVVVVSMVLVVAVAVTVDQLLVAVQMDVSLGDV